MQDWDYLFRRFPLIGAIALVIITGACIYTVATNTSVLGLLPAALALLLIGGIFWLARRLVPAAAADPADPALAEAGPALEAADADAIWDAHRRRQEAAHADPRQPTSAPTLEPGPGMATQTARPLSRRERLTLCIIPGALGGATVVLALTVEFLLTNANFHPAGQFVVGDVWQLFGLRMLPLSLLAGAWLGSLAGSRARAAAGRLGIGDKGLDVITVVCAAMAAAAGAVLVDACVFIGAFM